MPQPLLAETFVSAAVSVVLPWSAWPIVPTLQWGLVRLNFCLAMGLLIVARALVLLGCTDRGTTRAGQCPEPRLRPGGQSTCRLRRSVRPGAKLERSRE